LFAVREPDAHALKEPVVNGIGVGSCSSAACRTEGCLWSANSDRGAAPRPEPELRASWGLCRESGAAGFTAGCLPGL